MKNKSLLEKRSKISASSGVRALLVHGLSDIAAAGGHGQGNIHAGLAELIGASCAPTHAADGGSDIDDGIVNDKSVFGHRMPPFNFWTASTKLAWGK